MKHSCYISRKLTTIIHPLTSHEMRFERNNQEREHPKYQTLSALCLLSIFGKRINPHNSYTSTPSYLTQNTLFINDFHPPPEYIMIHIRAYARNIGVRGTVRKDRAPRIHGSVEEECEREQRQNCGVDEQDEKTC